MAALSTANIDKEILPFLSKDARPDCRCLAVQYFLGLTGLSKIQNNIYMCFTLIYDLK